MAVPPEFNGSSTWLAGGVTTFTTLLKVTVMLITAPTPYVPFAVVELTFVTVGAVVSITRFVLAAREPAAPGDGNVRVATFPAMSLIVPPLRDKAPVDV